MKKTMIIVLVAMLGCIGLLYGSSSRKTVRRVQSKEQQQPKKERSRMVYKGTNNPHSEKIPDLAARATTDFRIGREIGLPALEPWAGAFNLGQFLNKRACDADAIVIGTAVSSVVQLTEDQSFLFTTYQFNLEDILKNNAAQALNSIQSISIMRTGGDIESNGRRIIAEDRSAKPLRIGQRYLLFLSFLSEKNSYAADNISYEIKNDKILKLTEQSLERKLENGNSATLFIESVRAAAIAPCPTVGD